MAKEEDIQAEGVIVAKKGHGLYHVELDDSKHLVKCRKGGKCRNIKMLMGDRVKVTISTYNLDLGIITWRYL